MQASDCTLQCTLQTPQCVAGKDSYGMPSFTTVLKRIAQLWDTKRGELEAQVCDR
jgi:hypothetical protein